MFWMLHIMLQIWQIIWPHLHESKMNFLPRIDKIHHCFHCLPVADPGFPGRCANSREGGPTYYFVNFLPKTAWKWKNLNRGHPWRLDPPLLTMSCGYVGILLMNQEKLIKLYHLQFQRKNTSHILSCNKISNRKSTTTEDKTIHSS